MVVKILALAIMALGSITGTKEVLDSRKPAPVPVVVSAPAPVRATNFEASPAMMVATAKWLGTEGKNLFLWDDQGERFLYTDIKAENWDKVTYLVVSDSLTATVTKYQYGQPVVPPPPPPPPKPPNWLKSEGPVLSVGVLGFTAFHLLF